MFSSEVSFSSSSSVCSSETSASVSWIIVGAAIVAIVKSLSEIVGLTPSGSSTELMWIESPMFKSSSFISIDGGISLAGQINSKSYLNTCLVLLLR